VYYNGHTGWTLHKRFLFPKTSLQKCPSFIVHKVAASNSELSHK
jgi:hypothetical protein